MKIEGQLKYSFKLEDKEFTFEADVSNETALISLCLTNDMIDKFAIKLKEKKRKTPKDKHNLTCLKNTAYILREFIQGAVSDVKTEQLAKEQPKEEITETPEII